MMRCHYEVLGVPRDVETSTLRAAYKKCALKWHPDKNLDNVDKAKEEFQLVQQAFEVLSDPQERAWYDNHREAILKGGFGDNYQDDSLNLFPYFSASCYQGYGDDKKGFYAVYREVFNKIYAEDMGYNPDEDHDDSKVPCFGQSDSSYEEVVHPFYAYWENYSTSKTFVWLDEFDVREAPNRRVMRLMEKENKKVRDKARKERNEEIRTLVKFVRKRDKRLQKYRKILEEKAAENAKKAQLNRLRQLEERKREIAESKEAEWSKMENIESELKDIEAHLANEFGENSSQEGNGLEDEDEMLLDHLYCVACNKTFKNEKSFANHENSKKHKDNVAAIKVIIESDDNNSDVDEVEEVASDAEIIQNLDNEDEESSREHNGFSTSKKKIKSKKVLKPTEECFINSLSNHENDNDECGNDFAASNSKKQKKKNSRRKANNPNPTNNDMKSTEAESAELNSVAEDNLKPDQDFVNAQKGFDKKPKGKKNLDKHNKIPSDGTKDHNHTCATCETTFTHRNKLFQHLESSGHSVYIPKTTKLCKEKLPSKSKNKEF